MKNLIIVLLLSLSISSCTSKLKETSYVHTVIATYSDGKIDTIIFRTSTIEGQSFTKTGCTIYLTNNCLHILGCEECDLTGISRCDVRKYDHFITDKQEKIIEKASW